MKMKTIRKSVLGLFVILFATPLLRAQELGKYRNFSLGMNVSQVLKHTDLKMADVKSIYLRPALVQELTWWPPNLPGISFQADSVQQILFSFCDGELYKISIRYDRGNTEGLSDGDMVHSVSAKYGAPAKLPTAIYTPTNEQYDLRQKTVASWEDTQDSLILVRSSYSEGFGLILFSKQLTAKADEAIAKAAKLEEQERPDKEAERQQKEAADLEVARQKNRKIFHP